MIEKKQHALICQVDFIFKATVPFQSFHRNEKITEAYV